MSTSQNIVHGQFIDAEAARQSSPEIQSQWGVTASDGDWGIYCTACEQSFQYQPVTVGYLLNQHTKCAQGCPSGALDETVLIRRQAAPLIGDSEQILGQEWWHCSRFGPDHFEQDSVEHLGSRDAALHRAIGDQDLHNFDRHIYRFNLKPDATIEPTTWVESVWMPIEFSFLSNPSQYDLRPYINAKEAPGDLSLRVYQPVIASHTYVGMVTVDRGTEGNQGIAAADFDL